MEKYITTIEISNTEIRLAVGYVQDNKVNLIHVAIRPIPGLISHGEIEDPQTLGSILSSMKEFKDETTKEKIIINEATVVLPSFGLNVYQSSKTTNVVSPYSIIATLDIENVVSIVQKELIPSGNEIIDIIPDSFVLEMGRSYTYPPINEKSNSITINAKIHTLPSGIIDSYKQIFNIAKIKIRRMCVSTYAFAELAKNKEEIPQSYILVDIGSDITNVSLVGNSSPYETVSFLSGASDLINKISNRLNISTEESLELLQKFGLDERPLTFKPVIAKSMVEGVMTEHSPETLNTLIKEFFYEEYFPKFDSAYNTLLKGYQDNIRTLPVVFTGGITEMLGFDELAKAKFSTNSAIHYLIPDCMGARYTHFSALIGGLYASSKYKGSLSDTRLKNVQLQRVRDK